MRKKKQKKNKKNKNGLTVRRFSLSLPCKCGHRSSGMWRYRNRVKGAQLQRTETYVLPNNSHRLRTVTYLCYNDIHRILKKIIETKEFSHRNTNNISQTQLCFMNGTIQSYMFRFPRNHLQVIHTILWNSSVLQVLALYFSEISLIFFKKIMGISLFCSP